MKISGFQKLTLLDFPTKCACIIFTQGCNFRCPYCQNSGLIGHENDYLIDEEEIFSYLKKRKGLLDGIVISGGEPTVQKDLVEFIKKVKEIGYLVKLDTNGSNPTMLKELVDNNLVDYVAMDVKNTFKDYSKVTDCPVKTDNLKKSIDILANSNVEHEFRTTIIKNIHTIDRILDICDYVYKKGHVYLQNFEQSENVLGKDLESFTNDELIEIEKLVQKKYPLVKVRGIRGGE